MFKREAMLKVLTAAVIAASLTGCGGGSPAGVEEDWDDTGSYGTDPAGGYGAGTGAAGTGQYGGTTGGATGGYGGATGGYGGATGGYGGGMATGGDLTASVLKKKNGVFLGMGKFKCTVEVSNPSSVQKTGTLTVTFKNGSKASKTAPITESVSLGPNETKTFDYEDKKWSTDNVDVEITTDASSAGAPAPMAGGYGGATGGAMGGYGGAATGGYGGATGGAAGGYGGGTGY